MPGQDDLDALARRLTAAGHPRTATPGTLAVQDPSGNLLRFSADAGNRPAGPSPWSPSTMD
ncbi:hypothetical protein OG943_21270 [Amycolatopsis sp. NBC_00345]|uniref:hypothetical protein n=1 Tax=Amycolatopsis sp. NBC_00345 TaxID=2975955 RepID=UPI002E254285